MFLSLAVPPPYSGSAYPPPQPGYQPGPGAFPGAGGAQVNVTAVVAQPAPVVVQQVNSVR